MMVSQTKNCTLDYRNDTAEELRQGWGSCYVLASLFQCVSVVNVVFIESGNICEYRLLKS